MDDKIYGWLDVKECLIFFDDLRENDIVKFCVIDDHVSTQIAIDKDDHKIEIMTNNKTSSDIFYVNAWMDLFFVYFITTEKDNKLYFLKEIDRSNGKIIWSSNEFRGFLTNATASKFASNTKLNTSIRSVDVDTLCF